MKILGIILIVIGILMGIRGKILDDDWKVIYTMDEEEYEDTFGERLSKKDIQDLCDRMIKKSNRLYNGCVFFVLVGIVFLLVA